MINIYDDEENKRKVKEYKMLSRFYNSKREIYDFRDNENSQEIGLNINTNFNLMTEKEKSDILVKILSNKKIDDLLFKYELKNLDLNIKINDYNKFLKFVAYTFNKYHSRAGGHICNDTQWRVYDSTSKKYPLYKSKCFDVIHQPQARISKKKRFKDFKKG